MLIKRIPQVYAKEAAGMGRRIPIEQAQKMAERLNNCSRIDI